MKRSLRLRLFAIAFASSAIVAACNLLSGVGDLSVGASGEGAAVDGATGAEDAREDADGGGAGDADAGVVVPRVRCDDAGSVCLQAPPVGWIGPVLLYEGAAAMAAPPCSMGTSAYEGMAEPSAPPAGCMACNCGPPTGGDCNSVEVVTFNQGGCQGGNGGVCADVKLEVGACTSIPISCGNVSTFVSGAISHGGSCPPSGGALFDGGAPSWSRRALACALTNGPGSCEPDERCVPAPAFPFAGQCILKIGEDALCPSGDFSERHVYYDSFNDARKCTACGCSPPDGGCGTNTLQVTRCGPGEVKTSVPLNACGTTPITAALLTGSGSVQTKGSCTPTGGRPAGGIVGTGPTTVCCAP